VTMAPGGNLGGNAGSLVNPIPLAVQNAGNGAGSTLWTGIGLPASTLGTQGDIYFRKDGGVNWIYAKTSSSVWSPIV